MASTTSLSRSTRHPNLRNSETILVICDSFKSIYHSFPVLNTIFRFLYVNRTVQSNFRNLITFIVIETEIARSISAIKYHILLTDSDNKGCRIYKKKELKYAILDFFYGFNHQLITIHPASLLISYKYMDHTFNQVEVFIINAYNVILSSFINNLMNVDKFIKLLYYFHQLITIHQNTQTFETFISIFFQQT